MEEKLLVTHGPKCASAHQNSVSREGFVSHSSKNMAWLEMRFSLRWQNCLLIFAKLKSHIQM